MSQQDHRGISEYLLICFYEFIHRFMNIILFITYHSSKHFGHRWTIHSHDPFLRSLVEPWWTILNFNLFRPFSTITWYWYVLRSAPARFERFVCTIAQRSFSWSLVDLFWLSLLQTSADRFCQNVLTSLNDHCVDVCQDHISRYLLQIRLYDR